MLFKSRLTVVNYVLSPAFPSPLFSLRFSCFFPTITSARWGHDQAGLTSVCGETWRSKITNYISLSRWEKLRWILSSRCIDMSERRFELTWVEEGSLQDGMSSLNSPSFRPLTKPRNSRFLLPCISYLTVAGLGLGLGKFVFCTP